MSYFIGRFLQLAGMVILPIGFYIGFAQDDVRTEVKLLVIGGLLFVVGWMLARQPD